jgi:hypothetical protein
MLQDLDVSATVMQTIRSVAAAALVPRHDELARRGEISRPEVSVYVRGG